MVEKLSWTNKHVTTINSHQNRKTATGGSRDWRGLTEETSTGNIFHFDGFQPGGSPHPPPQLTLGQKPTISPSWRIKGQNSRHHSRYCIRMGLVLCCLPKPICRSPNPQYLRKWPSLEIGSLWISLVKKTFCWGWVDANAMGPVSCKRGPAQTDMHTRRVTCEDWKLIARTNFQICPGRKNFK